MLRGNGYRYPVDSAFSPLSSPSTVPDAEEIVDAVEAFFHTSKQSPNAVVFGGGFSEPFHSSSSDVLFEAMR